MSLNGAHKNVCLYTILRIPNSYERERVDQTLEIQ